MTVKKFIASKENIYKNVNKLSDDLKSVFSNITLIM